MFIKAPVPKSSFLSTEKDTALIVDKIMRNERIKRLLYYTSDDALDKPNITEDQAIELIGNSIKIVPKLYVDGKVLNYLFITFDSFSPTSNPEFKDNILMFDVVCHYTQWQLKDFALRPFKIGAEIDTMFNGQKLTGIGELNFLGATQVNYNDEFAGLCLMYRAVHGGEDKKFMPNPVDEDQFMKDWEDYITND